jgi:hypothetical protein
LNFTLTLQNVSEFGEKNERKLLRAAACKWLNSEQSDSNGEFLKPKKNYERWSHEGRTKQKLKIGGIFPKSGNKYVAPELMPGKLFTFFINQLKLFQVDWDLRNQYRKT